jgi:UDP-glucose 6-dehydrogenase
MLINDAFPSNYLKSSDLQGRNVLVKIDRVVYEEVNKERKLAMYFVGKDKPMILNKTNANTIALAYGQDTDDWRDAEVVLFVAMVDFQGKTVEALRVRVPPRKVAPRREEPQRDEQHRTLVTASDDPSDEIPF